MDRQTEVEAGQAKSKPAPIQGKRGGECWLHRQTDRQNPCIMSPDSTQTDTRTLRFFKRVSASKYIFALKTHKSFDDCIVKVKGLSSIEYHYWYIGGHIDELYW